jgi:antitoxin HicB
MLLDDYLNLPYTTILKRDEDGDYIASVKELKGCVAHGGTEMEALDALTSMKKLWLESCIADGCQVPLPEQEEDLPSGKWLQRVPRSIHAALVSAAEQEGVSLNQLVVSVLSREVGHREGTIETIQAAPEVADPWSDLVDQTYMDWKVKGAVTVQPSPEFVNALLVAIPHSKKLNMKGTVAYGDDKKAHKGWSN